MRRRKEMFLGLLIGAGALLWGLGASNAAVAPSPAHSPATTPSAVLPANILIQTDFQPSGPTLRPEHFIPAGRVPPFTLWDDGRVIYFDAEQPYGPVMEAQMPPEAARAMLEEVFDLGYARLESHGDRCGYMRDGSWTCITDLYWWFLRARLPSGELQEIKGYLTFTNDLAVVDAIFDLLEEYRAPEAWAYAPVQAALFLRPLRDSGRSMTQTASDWPLDPGLLSAADGVRHWVVILEGQDLELLLTTTGRNHGALVFENSGELYDAYLVPWLPSADYSDDLGGLPVVAR